MDLSLRDMPTILTWVFIGLVTGGIGGLAINARGKAMPGYIAAAFAGAALGGILAGQVLGIDALAQMPPNALIGSALGALALLAVLRRLPDRRPRPDQRQRA